MKRFLCALVAFVFLAGCQMPYSTRIYSDAAPNEAVLVSEFPREFSIDEIRRAILDSLHVREWQIGETTATGVRASLVHRKIESNIHIEIEPSRIVFYSDSWRLSRAGDRLSPEHPGSWLRNIEHDVRRYLGIMRYPFGPGGSDSE